MDRLGVALIVGVIQGVFEWLPVSSEGNVTLYLTVVEGLPPTAAVQLSLFLHGGTALAALAYYRSEIRTLLRTVPAWRPRAAFATRTADLSFYAIATLVSGVVGLAAYALLADLATVLAGGGFVALIGLLLVGTGIVQRLAEASTVAKRSPPDPLDAVLVGVLQGLAILPGVSRSGTTASALLLRGHDGPSSFRLSFVLSIPAALGAGALVALDTGVPAVAPGSAAVALVASALVGYLTIGTLMRLVRRVAFWGVCVGFGSLAVVGGLLIALA